MAKVIFSYVLYLDIFLLGPSITPCSQLKISGFSANFPIRSLLPGRGPTIPQNPSSSLSPRWQRESISSLWFLS